MENQQQTEQVQTQETQGQEAQVTQPQLSEVDLLKNQLLEKDREIQQRDEALYQQNIRLATFQELFEKNKALGMNDSQAQAQATQEVNQGVTTDGENFEYLNTKNAIDLFNKVLDAREQKANAQYTEQQKEQFLRQSVANDALNLFKDKYDFNGNYTDEEKKIIFKDRLPEMLKLVKGGYPSTEAAFKRAFFGLLKDKGLTGSTTQTPLTSGIADTNTQVTGTSGGNPGVVKQMEYERAKQALEKGEIPFSEYLSKWRAANGDAHLQPTRT